jgi:hypothetical protein
MGLAPPKIVRDATDEYFRQQDTVGMWIEECPERAPSRCQPLLKARTTRGSAVTVVTAPPIISVSRAQNGARCCVAAVTPWPPKPAVTDRPPSPPEALLFALAEPLAVEVMAADIASPPLPPRPPEPPAPSEAPLFALAGPVMIEVVAADVALPPLPPGPGKRCWEEKIHRGSLPAFLTYSPRGSPGAKSSCLHSPQRPALN